MQFPDQRLWYSWVCRCLWMHWWCVMNEKVEDEGDPLGPLRGVTPKLSFQPAGSLSSVQDYGATSCGSPWQWQS